jgi:Ca2+-binding RTX toxin-like protein
MRILKFTLTLISLILLSAALASARPLGVTTGDPVEDKFVEPTCASEPAPDHTEPVEDEAQTDPGAGTDEASDFSLHTGEQPTNPKDPEEDIEPTKDEWYDEDVFCGDGDDELILGEGDDEIDLGGGDDDVELGDGDDVGRGGSGDDELHGGPGDDDLFGGAGNDGVFGNGGRDDLAGGVGTDRVKGAGGRDDLAGGAGPDTVGGGAGADEVEGGPGADVITGGPGADKILSKDGTRDRVDCGAGKDRAIADKIDIVRNCE